MNPTRLIHLTVVLLLVAALIPAQQPVAAQPAAQEINFDAPFVPGEVVVSMPAGLTASTYRARATALAGRVGAAVVRQYKNMALLSFAPEADMALALAEVASAPGVTFVQPNYVYSLPEAASNLLAEPVVSPAYTVQTSGGEEITFSWPTLMAMRTRKTVSGVTQVIPAFPREMASGFDWGFSQVKADYVWQNTAAHAVCLLDTGVDTAHPDLSGRFLTGFDFVNNDTIPNDDNGHGTHVAGVITAKVNNTNNTAMGVSQAKIIPVKVLNAQGFGTSYTIAAGIQYCTSRTEPRVMNLSLAGSAASRLEYESLSKFVAKGRLVVAAAGNQSSSQYAFPAAWADPKVDMNGTRNPAGPDNLLHHSLISVGAGRAPSPYPVWVDENGNSQINDGELFNAEQCASGEAQASGAFGSNYGSWVNMVAPGEGIYSTTPVSYPFYMNYYFLTASKYDFLSGTSMAAGFVSGAAARVAKLRITVGGIARDLNAKEIKQKLMETGDTLATKVDGVTLDPQKGYDNQTSRPTMPTYGGVYSESNVILAPFCWPKTGASFTAAQDMSEAKYLNIAKALDRMALMAEVKDARTGTPVAGATVRIVDAKGVERGNVITQAGTSFVMALNIPANSTYRMRITKSGYTASNQEFVSGISGVAGEVTFDAYSRVSLPPNTGMHFVLDWRSPGEAEVDLDLYLAIPPVKNSGVTVSALIGPGDARDASKFDGTLEDYTFADRTSLTTFSMLDSGTLLDPAKFYGVYSPYAIHNFDGGKEFTVDPEGIAVSPTESISMRQGVTLTVKPWYRPKYTGNYYVYITDPHSTGVDSNLKVYERNDPSFTAPVLRYWSKGYLYAVVMLPERCNGTATWWRPLRINNTVIDASADTNTCGSAPY